MQYCMPHEKMNPESLYSTLANGYSHAVKTTGSVSIHCSGQVAWDANYQLVGGDDIGQQARQALSNLKVVLSEAGASISDIVMLRTYVVNHNPSLLEPISIAIGEFYGEETPAANTLVGVQALALPDFLIEIEAIAVVN